MQFLIMRNNQLKQELDFEIIFHCKIVKPYGIKDELFSKKLFLCKFWPWSLNAFI